jgi:hypothetical protein
VKSWGWSEKWKLDGEMKRSGVEGDCSWHFVTEWD